MKLLSQSQSGSWDACPSPLHYFERDVWPVSAANRIRNRERRRPEATGLNNKQLVNFYCPITSETNPIHAFSSVLDATVQSGQSASNISTLHCVYCIRWQLDDDEAIMMLPAAPGWTLALLLLWIESVRDTARRHVRSCSGRPLIRMFYGPIDGEQRTRCGLDSCCSWASNLYSEPCLLVANRSSTWSSVIRRGSCWQWRTATII